MHGPWPIDGRIDVRWVIANFRARSCVRRAPRRNAYSPTIRRFTVMPKGGHFAALEQPAALAHEIREFFTS
jgi:microsomal epoxide hydrolase